MICLSITQSTSLLHHILCCSIDSSHDAQSITYTLGVHGTLMSLNYCTMICQINLIYKGYMARSKKLEIM